jgi:hypothetical protein
MSVKEEVIYGVVHTALYLQKPLILFGCVSLNLYSNMDYPDLGLLNLPN